MKDEAMTIEAVSEALLVNLEEYGIKRVKGDDVDSFEVEDPLFGRPITISICDKAIEAYGHIEHRRTAGINTNVEFPARWDTGRIKYVRSVSGVTSLIAYIMMVVEAHENIKA